MSCYRCGKPGHPPRATAYRRSLMEPHPDDDLRLMRAYTTMYPITSYLQSPLPPRGHVLPRRSGGTAHLPGPRHFVGTGVTERQRPSQKLSWTLGAEATVNTWCIAIHLHPTTQLLDRSNSAPFSLSHRDHSFPGVSLHRRHSAARRTWRTPDIPGPRFFSK